ncbi:LOW QUALITY PROTEIN: hypothetical protein CRUP_034774 [Coryphaenoides rupestris]|nr:LOW QUALITY PROTEIN: hypothetical protein CRUP_034774 [Coryphaenoides rupestris]
MAQHCVRVRRTQAPPPPPSLPPPPTPFPAQTDCPGVSRRDVTSSSTYLLDGVLWSPSTNRGCYSYRTTSSCCPPFRRPRGCRSASRGPAMDTSLHVLQKPTDVSSGKIGGGGCGGGGDDVLDMSLGMDRRNGFGLPPDNIPLVKPYFKKKHGQRKLDTKCLHRALEDPILQTLLSTDALVTGDGVFVPHNESDTGEYMRGGGGGETDVYRPGVSEGPGAAGGGGGGVGVAVAVAGLLGHTDTDAEMADTTAELEETERRRSVERPKLAALEMRQRVAMDSSSDCFQLKPTLRGRDVIPAAGQTVTMAPPARVTPLASPPPPRQDGGRIKTADLFASEASRGAHCHPIKASRGPPPLTQAPPHDKGVLFQNKSEEASLDLVFELLTQLQYHTHQSEAVSVCVDFLQGLCVYGSDCAHHHTVLPYHWQIHSSSSHTWQSIADESQEQLERLYCNPDNEQVRLKFQGRVFSLDFGAMLVCDMEFDRVRRLSTPPSPTTAPPLSPGPNPAPSCHTPVVRLIEEASGRGLKEVRFITLQNQYILNIKEGFQQNAVFGFRRQIKKRPMFTSSVMLSPHLQTLGALSSSPHPSSSSTDPLAAPLPLSPTACGPPTLFPETWLPMASSQDFLQVPVSREDRSYRTVYSLFHKTVSETKFRVLKILRVQNPFLWEKYKRSAPGPGYAREC